MTRIRLDASPVSVLVVCECGYRELALSAQVAHRLAVLHELNCHPNQHQARELVKAATRRARHE
ncbi:hypothetical protein [Schaalia hyovaginalis]|uniref:hypothetical protein n=1 Tax=Schaalia hyovaginalis TaxID=29316 RepID=UPI0026EE65AE|nr:hypothetical protein [Schaalia hyovaginalis]MCI6557334.1 hypothetical protein [Schaalia hyovaginalis]MDY3094209.1 hypothetical protein [Schaalia hyovaginalis]MDY3664722.1 hypothetical protein [Schaalia hyovaginalis]